VGGSVTLLNELCSNVYALLTIFRSLLLEKSNEIIRLKQDNDKYKQRLEKYGQELKDKDKEISGIWMYEFTRTVL